MAYDKIVDSAKLDSGMTATANAIRAKTGGTSAIPWNETTGFADAVGDISQAEDLSAELAAQDALISQLEEAVAGKASGGGGGTAEPPNIQSLTVTENGTYTASENVDGYSPVVVAVPEKTPVLQPLTVTENGTYPVPESVDGYGTVTVNVPSSGDSGGGAIETCDLTISLRYAPGAYISHIWYATETDGVLNTITAHEQINNNENVVVRVVVGTPVVIEYFGKGYFIAANPGVNTDIVYEDFGNYVIVKCTKSGSGSLILEGIE